MDLAASHVTVMLPVRDLARARRFYEKYDFEPEGTYAFMVGNHADEDIVMRLKL